MVDPLEIYKPNAFEVTFLKLIREKEDLDDDEEAFNPDLTHQIFGQSEIIFGYKDLNVVISYWAGCLKTLVEIEYSSKIPPSLAEGVEPDDILGSLNKVCLDGITTDRSKFLEYFEEELNFKPYGSLEKSYTIGDGDGCRVFEIYYIDAKSPDFEKFKQYLKRMEPFLLFFVDEAVYVTLDDEWSFHIIYEKFKSPGAPNDRFAFVGYASVYFFYAYPEHTRPRISQVVILPPFQKMGHCTRLLQAIYDRVVPLPKTIDVTFESPADDLIRVRNYLDCKRCLLECPALIPILKRAQDFAILPSTNGESASVEPPAPKRRRTLEPSNKSLSEPTTVYDSSESINAGYKSMLKKFTDTVRPQLKLSKFQAGRVFNILVYFVMSRNNPGALKEFDKTLLCRKRNADRRYRALALALSTAEREPNFDQMYEKELKDQVKVELDGYRSATEKLTKALEKGDLGKIEGF